ncbi:MAG: winged helix DNA-binding protein [Alteraurantiacibacter sp.]
MKQNTVRSLKRSLEIIENEIGQIKKFGTFDGCVGIDDSEPHVNQVPEKAFELDKGDVLDYYVYANKKVKKGKCGIMPDPRLIKQILRNRQLRDNHFDPSLFADPAWDMILDLMVAREEHRRISVTSLCVAARVPGTTALRWINTLIERGLIERFDDPSDKRRSFVRLSDKGAKAAADFFEDCASNNIKVL